MYSIKTQMTDIPLKIQNIKQGDKTSEINCMDQDGCNYVGCVNELNQDNSDIVENEDNEEGTVDSIATLKKKYETTETRVEELLTGQQETIGKLAGNMENMQTRLLQRKAEIVKALEDLQNEFDLKKDMLLKSTESEVESNSERLQAMKLRCRQNIDKINTLDDSNSPEGNHFVQKDMSEECIRLEKKLSTEGTSVEALDVEWPVLDTLARIHKKLMTCDKSFTLTTEKKGIVRCEDVPDQLKERHDGKREDNGVAKLKRKGVVKVEGQTVTKLKHRRVVKTEEHIVNQMTGRRVVKTEEHPVSLETGWFPVYTGITVVNQYLLLCDNCGGNSLCGHVRLYDPVSKSVSKLKIFKPFGAAVLKSNHSHIAVSVPKDKFIHIISIEENTLGIVKTFQLDKTPYNLIGLENGHLGVTLDSPPSFDIIDVSGDTIRTVKSYTQDSSGRQFKSFQYAAVDEPRSHIIQPCTRDHAVYCFDMEGNHVFEYRDSELRMPRGVDIDRDGNIYICSYDSGALHVVSPSGYKVKIIKEGIPGRPQAVCFDETRERFWVTSCLGYNNDKVCMFSLQD